MTRMLVAIVLCTFVAACSPSPRDAAPADNAAQAAQESDLPPPPDVMPPPEFAKDAPAVPTTTDAPKTDWVAGSPSDVVQRFYDLHAAHSSEGAPDAATLATYAPFLSTGLHDAVAAARAESERAAREQPGEKPPYVEGALFASLFEGYTTARPLTLATEGDKARVPVQFTYSSDGQTTQWTDTVVLVREGGTWRIDDVVYGGQWDFANQGRLRDALKLDR